MLPPSRNLPPSLPVEENAIFKLLPRIFRAQKSFRGLLPPFRGAQKSLRGLLPRYRLPEKIDSRLAAALPLLEKIVSRPAAVDSEPANHETAGARMRHEHERAMKTLHSTQLEILTAVLAFYQRHIALVPKETRAAELFGQIESLVPEVRKSMADREEAVNLLRRCVNVRELARAALIQSLDNICNLSQSFDPPYVALKGQLRKLHFAGHQALVSHALGIAGVVEPMKEKFVTYHMPPDFVEELREAISRYDRAIGDHLIAGNVKVNATARVNDDMKKVLLALYRLDGIVPNIARDNEAVLKEWRTARRMKRRGRPPK